MARRRSAANPSARAQAGTLVADTARSFCQSLACLAELDLAGFVSSLATAWRAGEVRPTHRQEPKPGHWWRTRPDPFAKVWPVLLSWLEERPDMEAKEMLKRLQATGYGEFPRSEEHTSELQSLR